MTKKAIILIIILVVLLCTIVVSAVFQYKRNLSEIYKGNAIGKTKNDDKFSLNITNETGFDLEEMKAYKIPIIIQFGSSNDEVCIGMKSSLEKLNYELKGLAFIKYFDADKYSELWNESLVPLTTETMQLLINSDGTPYSDDISEVFGYKAIKDEEGNHVYTVHFGDLSINDMMKILKNMEKNINILDKES